MEAGFLASKPRRGQVPEHVPSKRTDASTSFEGADPEAATAQKKAQLELKIKELDRQIEEQRSRERALADQGEASEKNMGDNAILTPQQEQAALKSREIALQQDAVVDKTEQLVKEKLELLKELEKLQQEESTGKAQEEVTPGETVTREIVGPAGEKEVEVVKEEEGGKEEIEEVKEETPEEAKQIEESGGQIVSPPPAPSPEMQEAEQELEDAGLPPMGPMGEPEPEPVECPPCPPLPKPRERPLMISAEDEPPGKAPRVEVDVTESQQVPQQTFLFAPPETVRKNVRFRVPAAQRLVALDTAGDDAVHWKLPPHKPGLLIGSHPPSLAGALMDDEVADENEVPDEYDDEPQPEEVMEAQRGGRVFSKMDVQQQALPALWLAALRLRATPARRRVGGSFL